MQLPLLGGDNAGHDWNNLLAMTNTLKYTDIIGKIIYTIGIIVILLAIFASLINYSTDKKQLSLNTPFAINKVNAIIRL